ncbi:phage tail tip lysozyme, partial [Burkholderia territorii]
QRDASKALTDAAKDLASAMSTNASAAEMPPSSPVAPGKAKDAAAAFMRMGWSKEQAAGLAANLNVESGLRPDIVGDNGAAYGIGQWHADRQAEFRRVFGHDIRGSSLDEQLQFVHYELTRGREQAAGRALRRATTAGEAGAIVSSKYERPLKVQEEMVKRSEAASALYGSLGTALPSVGPAMAAAQQSAAGNSAVNSHNRSEVHVGQITVVSPDTSNGAKVGQDLRHDLSQHGLIAGAAYGMT